jgi:DNA (cytosine-5)-methyltransferase 1
MRLVDLFCGTGGFARGAERAGFEVVLAVDYDKNLTYSHAHNFPNTKLLSTDIGPLTGSEILAAAGGEVDGIFGGPPCQGFSSIGRRDPSDARRKLLGHFFRIVAEVKPKFFVMENVRGLLDKDGRGELDEGLRHVNASYHIEDPHVWDASDYGAATKRKRIFVIGTRKDIGVVVTDADVAKHKKLAATVRDAIGDLATASLKEDDRGFDVWKIPSVTNSSEYARSLHSPDSTTTGLRVTVHREEIARRFSQVPQGGKDDVGRHPRLDWTKQCPTLRAGTGSDKGSYQAVRPLHPSENRVITVREAARLQGFPDEHRFHPTVWHSFRMIGNSVAPLMAQAIFRAVGDKLGTAGGDARLQAAE